MFSFLQKIVAQKNLELLEVKRLSGGDINDVYLLKCTNSDFVIKLNYADKFPGMFEAEAKGLSILKASESFNIPEIINYGIEGERSYLLLENIEQGGISNRFWPDFAERLEQLHRSGNKDFGLDHSNYIGSLPQQNNHHDVASEFYVDERLEPQFTLARDHGYLFSDLDAFYKNISEIIPTELPSLIHGDLWSGNYLVSSKGEPVLIDPAVAFASREMDLAMMQLFGGFPSEVFSIYNEIFPLTENWESRIPLWQLYYLLVHLNLFGSGYLSRVEQIVKSYS
jgi:fructosamine-3-kinase